MSIAPEKAFSEGEIVGRLAAELPRWRLVDGSIRRKYGTSGWKSTLMVVNAIGHLAEAAWHHPEIHVSYASVEVQLSTHSAKGITAKDFELALKIEDVVGWQPGKEGGALEGPPAGDPRFAHVIHDSGQ